MGCFAHGAAPVPAAVAAGIAAVVLPPSRSRSILPTLFANASSLASDGFGSATVTGTVAEACIDAGWRLADAEHDEVAGDHAGGRAAGLSW